MKTLSLRPYPGKVIVCKSRKEYMREHSRIFKREGPDLSGKGGRMDFQWSKKSGRVYLVWAASKAYLSHELSHVMLNVFELVGIDPREAGGEPFCYMLSQLMLEAE
jgi:hypothetical protein